MVVHQPVARTSKYSYPPMVGVPDIAVAEKRLPFLLDVSLPLVLIECR